MYSEPGEGATFQSTCRGRMESSRPEGALTPPLRNLHGKERF